MSLRNLLTNIILKSPQIILLLNLQCSIFKVTLGQIYFVYKYMKLIFPIYRALEMG